MGAQGRHSTVSALPSPGKQSTALHSAPSPAHLGWLGDDSAPGSWRSHGDFPATQSHPGGTHGTLLPKESPPLPPSKPPTNDGADAALPTHHTGLLWFASRYSTSTSRSALRLRVPWEGNFKHLHTSVMRREDNYPHIHFAKMHLPHLNILLKFSESHLQQADKPSSKV